MLLLVLSVLLLSSFAFAATLEVTTGTSCVGSPDGTFTTIQAAINNASTGDVVIVCDGTYTENVEVNTSINLSGETPDVTVVAFNDTLPAITTYASNVNITNFTVTGADGIGDYSCGLLVGRVLTGKFPDTENVTVYNVIAEDNDNGFCVYDDTVSLVGLVNVTADGNDIGIFLTSLSTTYGPNYVFVINSTMTDNAVGLKLYRTNYTFVYNNTFYANNRDAGHFDISGGFGVWSQSHVRNLDFMYNNISENDAGFLAGCDWPCITLGEHLADARIAFNNFTDNVMLSLVMDQDHIDPSSPINVTGNRFTGDTLFHFVTDDMYNLTVADNYFSDAVACIGFGFTSGPVDIFSNYITDCQVGMAFLELEENTLFVYDNELVNNYFNFGVLSAFGSGYIQNISTNNTVDGKPIYYFVNGTTGDGNTNFNPVPADAGYVALILTNNSRVENLLLEHNINGLVALESVNVTVDNVSMVTNFWGAFLGTVNSTYSNVEISDCNNPVITPYLSTYLGYFMCGLITAAFNNTYNNFSIYDQEECYLLAMNATGYQGWAPGWGDTIYANNFTIGYTETTGLINYRYFEIHGGGSSTMNLTWLVPKDLSLFNATVLLDDFIVLINDSDPAVEPYFENPANVTLLGAGCPLTYYNVTGFPTTEAAILTAATEFTPNIISACNGGLTTFEVPGFTGYFVAGPEDDEDDGENQISLDYERLECPENGVLLTATRGNTVLSNVEFRVLFNSLFYDLIPSAPGEYQLMLTAEGDYDITARKSSYNDDSVSFTFELCEVDETHLACVNSACVRVSGAGENLCSSSADCEETPVYECYSDGDCDDAYFCDIPAGQIGGTCEPVTGECGYPQNHTWVQYECGNEVGCQPCPEGEVCVNHVCAERLLTGPETGFVGDNVTLNGKENGGPCALCDVVILNPVGETLYGKTNTNGDLNLPLTMKGNYSIGLLAPDGAIVSTIIVEALPKAQPSEPSKPTQEMPPDYTWLWFLILLLILAAAFFYLRKRGKK